MTCSAARNGASSSTYITASAKNDATSDSAPTTGLRCSTTIGREDHGDGGEEEEDGEVEIIVRSTSSR